MWAQAWPDAKLYASRGLARRRRDLAFTRELEDAPDSAWATDIDQIIFHGSFVMDEVVFFHRSSRSVLVTDLVQKFDPATLHGWRGAIVGLDGFVWHRRQYSARVASLVLESPCPVGGAPQGTCLEPAATDHRSRRVGTRERRRGAGALPALARR